MPMCMTAMCMTAAGLLSRAAVEDGVVGALGGALEAWLREPAALVQAAPGLSAEKVPLHMPLHMPSDMPSHMPSHMPPHMPSHTRNGHA